MGARGMSTRTPDPRKQPGRSHQSVLALGLLLAAWACSPGGDSADGAAGGSSGRGESAAVAEGSGGDRGAVASEPAARPPAGRAWVIFDADTVVAEVAAT